MFENRILSGYESEDSSAHEVDVNSSGRICDYAHKRCNIFLKLFRCDCLLSF